MFCLPFEHVETLKLSTLLQV